MGYFLQIARNEYFWVKCQNSSKASGCYSDLKSFIIIFVSYFQTKNFKGTFLIYQGAFHHRWKRGRGQLEYPPQNTLSASSGTPVRQRFKLKRTLPSLHQKQLLQVSVTNVGFLCVPKRGQTKQKKKTGASKEHLPPPAHVVGLNSGSSNKTISSAARRHHCMQRRFPLFAFKSPVTSTRELRLVSQC